jgi:hypothetical protein
MCIRRARTPFAFAVWLALWFATPTRAQEDRLDPGRFPQPPRFRLCCAFGTEARIDIGTSHAPVLLDMVGSPEALGRHSYLGLGKFSENNALVYTCRGGFIDLAHVRETGDWTAYLATRLRPALARGGAIPLPDGGAPRTLRVRAAPDASGTNTDALSVQLGQRIAYELMWWSEIEQWAGLLDVAGIYEKPSGLSPDDPYSNLLGVYVGARALLAPGNYEDNFDRELAEALRRLGAVSAGATREALWRVNGRWWDGGRAWPDAHLTMRRATEFGPVLQPMRLDPQPPECAGTQALESLTVPERDASGTDLAARYAFEVRPDLAAALGPSLATRFRALTPAGFPQVAAALGEKERVARLREPGSCGLDDPDCDRAVGHFLNGLRLFVLEALGGAHHTANAGWRAGFGGRVAAIDAQTRGGDLRVLGVQVVHDQGARGLATTLTFARSDELYFCEEPGRGVTHPPLLGWMRACRADSVVYLGGDVGELLHDGDSGRTVVRPLSLRLGLNPLGNGYAESYDHVRLLAWIGGSFDNVWTAAAGPELSPRAQAGLRMLLRSPSQRWEFDLRGMGHLDPAETSDRGVEAALALAHQFLLGGGGDDNPDGAAHALHRTLPWAMLRVALQGSYARWDEPKSAFPVVAGPFVSDRERDSLQALLGVTFVPTAMTF